MDIKVGMHHGGPSCWAHATDLLPLTSIFREVSQSKLPHKHCSQVWIVRALFPESTSFPPPNMVTTYIIYYDYYDVACSLSESSKSVTKVRLETEVNEKPF